MKRLTGKFTKAIALTLMVVILLSMAMPMAAAWNAPRPDNELFPDSRNHWAGRDGYIGWAMANGITTGFPDGTFRPSAAVTRAEFVTFLHRVAGAPSASRTATFSDMPTSSAFVAAISWAAEEGVTTGFPDGTFRPNARIQRQQIATMLHRHIGGAAPAGALDRFTDSGQVASWALDGMRWAASNGIMGVNVAAINPGGNATRGETVAMLSRVVDTFNLPAPPLPTTETANQRNAIRAANNFISIMPFSRSELINRLEFEGHSNADAVHAVDNIGANWYEHAARRAQQYLGILPFSRSRFIDQLVSDGFTRSQATHGVNAVGL